MKLVDTSVWIDHFYGKQGCAHLDELQELLQRREAAWCDMVRLELQRISGKSQERALEILDTLLPKLEIDQSCWELAFLTARMCRRSGKPVPNTDILIHATGRRHGCPVLHADRHFEAIESCLGEEY